MSTKGNETGLRTFEEAMTSHRRECEDAEWIDTCPICDRFTGNRNEIFAHFLGRHGLNIGRPEGIVDAKGLIDLMRQRIRSLRCLLCERGFSDIATLMGHMKKKQHVAISAANSAYDRFYLVNYQTPRTVSPSGPVTEEEEEEDGDEIEEEEEREETKCLFCEAVFDKVSMMAEHCSSVHSGFSLGGVVSALSLDFYGAISFVNWLRETISGLRCPCCQERSVDPVTLVAHMSTASHFPLAIAFSSAPRPWPWEHDRFLVRSPGSSDDPVLWSFADCGCQFPGPE